MISLDLHASEQGSPVRSWVLVEHGKEIHKGLDRRPWGPEVGLANPRFAVTHEVGERLVGQEVPL